MKNYDIYLLNTDQSTEYAGAAEVTINNDIIIITAHERYKRYLDAAITQINAAEVLAMDISPPSEVRPARGTSSGVWRQPIRRGDPAFLEAIENCLKRKFGIILLPRNRQSQPAPARD